MPFMLRKAFQITTESAETVARYEDIHNRWITRYRNRGGAEMYELLGKELKRLEALERAKGEE